MYDRDRLLDAIDLPDLADDLLGPRTGSARTPTWPCPNPNHAQTGRTPPVTIFEGRGGDQRWHCHGCGAGGTAIDLVMAIRGANVRESLDTLAARTGLRPSTGTDTIARRPRRPPPPPAPTHVTDPEGLADYIDSCAQRLWTPAGRPVLRWLTRTRGLPPDVLRHNRIGADPGASRQPRPDGMPAAGWAAVLPVRRDGIPVFAQIRVLGTGRLRYLNASSDLAPNPRHALYQPVEQRGSCVLVTEGSIDALSAAAAGFRSAALLSASLPDPGRPGTAAALVDQLSSLNGRLIVALDADDAGQRGADRLQRLLHHARPDTTRLPLPAGVNDLNDWMRDGPRWADELTAALRTAIDNTPARTISR